MRHTISLSDDKAFIVLKMQGKITSNAALRCNIECHAMGRELGINRFLVDATEGRNIDWVDDTYYFAYKDLKSPFIDQTARVALLVKPEDTSHNFVETVCRNAGYDVTLFTEREFAERHLKQE